MIEKENCPCGSGIKYATCCEPIINGERKAKSALELMKSRYSAYVKCEVDYIMQSIAPSERQYYSKSDILKWAQESNWLKLEIIDFTVNTVEFKAFYHNSNGKREIHHEFSTFILENDTWYFLEGNNLK